MISSLDFIKSVAIREAFVSIAYFDGTFKKGEREGKNEGDPKYSWAFGSQDPMPNEGDTITFADGWALLLKNVATRDGTVDKMLTAPVTQQQHEAINDLLYQRGSAAARAVAAHFNNHEPELAYCEFGNWASGQNGIPTEGHAKRRNLERDLARHGMYGDLSHFLSFAGNPRLVRGVPTEFPADLRGLV